MNDSEGTTMAHIGTIIWHCERCSYKIMTQDESGKPFKKVPATCPSCGTSTKAKAPQPASRDPKP